MLPRATAAEAVPGKPAATTRTALADAREAFIAECLERVLQRRHADLMQLGELAHERQRITSHQLTEPDRLPDRLGDLLACWSPIASNQESIGKLLCLMKGSPVHARLEHLRSPA